MIGSSQVLFVAALAFATGIGAAWHWDVLLPRPWFLGLVTGLILAWILPPRGRCRTGVLFVSLVCLGGLAAASQWIWWSEWVDQVTDVGSLSEMKATPLQLRSDRWVIIPAADQWPGGAKGRPPLLQLRSGALDPMHSLQSADIGRCICVSGRLVAPKRPGNPGEFDAVTYALSRSLMGDLRLDAIIPCAADSSVRFSLQAVFSRMRASWRENISRSIPGEAGSLVGAIVLGDYSLLSAEAREMLQRAGLAHITSVSGLHVSLVISTVSLLVGGATGGWGWMSLVVAALFVMLSGGRASSIRALLTATVALLGRRRGGRVDPWASLSLAWLCLLTVNPALLGDSGFVLSFSSVAGILLLARPLMMTVHSSGSVSQRLGRRLWNGFVLSVSAQLATAPASAAFFNSLSVLAPVVNIVGVPLATVVLVTGLAGCLLEACRGFLQIPGLPLLWVAGRAANALLWLGSRTGGIGWAGAELATPGWAATAAWVCAMICVSCLVRMRHLPRVCRLLGSRQIVRWGLLAVCLQLLVVIGHLWPPPGTMSITFFDVGQGDAILIQAPRGRAVLVDAGGRTRNWDASRLLVPQLKRLGVKEIDVAINTHPHADHLGGMAGILAERRVRWMWETGRETETVTYAMYRQRLSERKTPVRQARAGDILKVGNVEFQILWPPADMGVHRDVNFHSIVLRVTFGRVAVMLMADAPVEVQQALLESMASVEAVLWKVSHQGAHSSFDETFAEAVKPQVSVISVGSNAYGHPTPEVVDRLQGMGVVCRTDLDGAVRFVTDGRRWRVAGRHGSSCQARGRL